MDLLPRKTNLRLLFRRPRLLARHYRLALLVLAVGAVADGITTFNVMIAYGADTELHPPQRLLSEWFGVPAGVPLAKLTQVAFVILVASYWRPWCKWLLAGCGLLYALAALSNYCQWL